MLYSQSYGQGPDLVLLHGWGFNGDIFQGLVEQYQHQYRVTLIDLPGHGRSKPVAGGLPEWSDAVMAALPNNPILLGWSLGGLLAIHIASQVAIQKLILVASTPKFVQDPHWPYGIDSNNFKQFADELNQNPAKGIKRFIGLQTRDRGQLKTLNQAIDRHPIDLQTLNQGLGILLETDLTQPFQALKIDKQIILGDKDTLVPDAIHHWYQQQGAQSSVLNSGHMPFLQADFDL